MFLSHAEFNAGTLTLNFTPETGDNAVTAITAGTPYIIKWAGDGSDNIVNPTFAGVTISTDVCNKTCDLGEDKSITFRGTYGYRLFTDIDKSILFFGTNNTLYYPENGATIAACRAYFQLNGISAADLPVGNVKMFFGDEETSIHDSQFIIHDEAETWYTLDGRRLSGKPTQRGIYINNGRKVVMK